MFYQEAPEFPSINWSISAEHLNFYKTSEFIISNLRQLIRIKLLFLAKLAILRQASFFVCSLLMGITEKLTGETKEIFHSMYGLLR